MSARRNPFDLLHSRWFAYLIGLLFVISGILHMLDTSYEFPLLKMASLRFAAGLMGIPLGCLAWMFFGRIDPGNIAEGIYVVPTVPQRLLELIIIVAAALLITRLLRLLQKYRRVFKLLVFLNYLPLVLLCLVVLLEGSHNKGRSSTLDFLTGYSQVAVASCEYPVTETTTLHLDYYFQRVSTLSFPHTSYRITTDSGNTWREFMVAFISGRDAGIDLVDSCQDSTDAIQTGAYDSRVFWFWQGKALAVTHDGGMTWQVFDEKTWKFPSRQNILAVHFDGSQSGEVLIEHYDRQSRSNIRQRLVTHDGGMTWQTGH